MLARDVSLLPSLCFICCDDVDICPCRCVGQCQFFPCLFSRLDVALDPVIESPAVTPCTSLRGDGILACLRDLIAIKHVRHLAYWIVVGWASHVPRPIGRPFAIKPHKKPELSRGKLSQVGSSRTNVHSPIFHLPSLPRKATDKARKRKRKKERRQMTNLVLDRAVAPDGGHILRHDD